MSSHAKPPVSRSARTRLMLLAPIAALVLTSFDVHAAPLARSSADHAPQLAPAADSDFGARKRGRRGNGAAGLAMMGLMVGTISTVIAAQQRREAYEAYNRRAYGYYGHPSQHVYHQPYVHHRPYVHVPAARHYGHHSQGYYPPGHYPPQVLAPHPPPPPIPVN